MHLKGQAKSRRLPALHHQGQFAQKNGAVWHERRRDGHRPSVRPLRPKQERQDFLRRLFVPIPRNGLRLTFNISTNFGTNWIEE